MSTGLTHKHAQNILTNALQHEQVPYKPTRELFWKWLVLPVSYSKVLTNNCKNGVGLWTWSYMFSIIRKKKNQLFMITISAQRSGRAFVLLCGAGVGHKRKSLDSVISHKRHRSDFKWVRSHPLSFTVNKLHVNEQSFTLLDTFGIHTCTHAPIAWPLFMLWGQHVSAKWGSDVLHVRDCYITLQWGPLVPFQQLTLKFPQFFLTTQMSQGGLRDADKEGVGRWAADWVLARRQWRSVTNEQVCVVRD